MQEMLPQFEQLLDAKIDALTQKIEKRLEDIEAKIASAKSSESVVAHNAPTADNKKRHQSDTTAQVLNENTAFLDFLNSATLQDLEDLGVDVRNHALASLINQREKNGVFTSRQDCLARLQRSKKFSKVHYEKLLNKWSKKNAPVDANSTENQFQQPEIVATEASVSTEAEIVETVSEDVPTSETDAEDVPTKPARSQHTSKSNKSAHGIDKFNTMTRTELTQLLSDLKLSKKIINAILDQRPFTSFEDMDIQGLEPKKKLAIKDAF